MRSSSTVCELASRLPKPTLAHGSGLPTTTCVEFLNRVSEVRFLPRVLLRVMLDIRRHLTVNTVPVDA
jgi:hypothetical protein